jgi:hypothetical protein
MMKPYGVVWILLGICLLLSPLSAQVKSSAITGTVTDPHGAVVPNATVTITNDETGVTSATKTTGEGNFTLPYLPVGVYTLVVNLPGFETYRKTGIVLVSATTVRADVTLALGSTSATVTVKADALALQTESATVQDTIDKKLISTLPNINGNPLYYASLDAGVVPTWYMYNSQALGVGFSDRQAMSAIRVNGGELGSDDVQLDGLSVQGAAWHETAVVPNPDALQEVRVTANTFTAETGDAQAVISMNTKSGTNGFHGDLNYMIRNEDLNANGFYNNAHGVPRPTYRLLQGGGSVGGPVIIPKLFNGKEKLFFFVSYLKLTHSEPVTSQNHVPTDLERAGDFSQTMVPDINGNPVNVNIYNPFTATPVPGSTTLFERQIYPNAKVTNPNQYGLALLKGYPEPNHPASDAYQNNNYYFSGTQPVVRQSLNTRIDYRLSQKQALYFTGGIENGSSAPPNMWGASSIFKNENWPGLTSDNNPYGALGDTIVLNPTTVIDIRYGVTRINTQSRTPPSTGVSTSQFGMPSNVGALTVDAGDAPVVGNFGSLDNANFDGVGSLNLPWWDNKSEHQTNHAVTGSMTKVLGRWTLKGGAEYRVYLGNWADLEFPTATVGLYSISTGASGSGQYSIINGYNAAQIANPADRGLTLATPVMGTLGWGMPSGSSPVLALAAKYVAFYTQNSWRVNKKLNLSLGLRYEVQPGPTERYNRMSSVNLGASNPYATGTFTNTQSGLGLLTFPGVNGINRNLYESSYNNVSPRLGATYQFDNSTVLRGGYGRNYLPSNTGFNANGLIYGTTPFSPGADPIPYGLTQNGLPAGTFDQALNTNIIPSAGATQAPSIYGNNSSGSGVDIFDRYGYKTGVTDQWNFIVERRLGPEWLVSVGYIASRSSNLPWRQFAINGPWNVPSGTLQSWRNTWVASNGTNDPSQVQVPNPLPALVGKAAGPISSTNLTALQAQESYLPFLGQTISESYGSSNYNALEVRGQHALSHGLLLSMNYTWSKSMGNTGGPGSQTFAESQMSGSTPGNGGVDYINRQANYSLLGFDTPNRFVATVSYLLPTDRGMALDPGNAFMRAVIGGWNLSSATTVQSGQPWGPNCGGTMNERCNVVSGEPVQVPKSLQKWYNGTNSVSLPDGRTITPPAYSFLKWNPDRFTQPVVQFPNGSFGIDQYTSGSTAIVQGDLRTPIFSNTNISVIRKFALGDWASLNLHVDATNAFNRSNIQPYAINNSVGSILTAGGGATVGQNSNTGFGTLGQNFAEPRQLTLTLRLDF